MIQPPRGEHRKATSSDASSGRPTRPSGVASRMRSKSAGGIQPVSVGPGLTALTVIPFGPSSVAAGVAEGRMYDCFNHLNLQRESLLWPPIERGNHCQSQR